MWRVLCLPDVELLHAPTAGLLRKYQKPSPLLASGAKHKVLAGHPPGSAARVVAAKPAPVGDLDMQQAMLLQLQLMAKGLGVLVAGQQRQTELLEQLREAGGVVSSSYASNIHVALLLMPPATHRAGLRQCRGP